MLGGTGGGGVWPRRQLHQQRPQKDSGREQQWRSAIAGNAKEEVGEGGEEEDIRRVCPSARKDALPQSSTISSGNNGDADKPSFLARQREYDSSSNDNGGKRRYHRICSFFWRSFCYLNFWRVSRFMFSTWEINTSLYGVGSV